MEKYAVEFTNVSKIYKLEDKRKRWFSNKKQFYALQDISFKVKQGSVMGILGTNGSGKSTLSNILAGISSPSKGEVVIHGEQALIAIKAGLNNQLTGLENIRVKGALLGLSKKRVAEITEGVIEFAELGEFLYQPVKKYSSGMKSRLGFSISLCLNPDIFIVDEALSVGDKAFAAKCEEKMLELKEQGKTIFFVSHSLAQVREFCEDGMWIEGGKLKAIGTMSDVANQYEAYVDAFKQKSKSAQKETKERLFEERVVR